MNDIATPAASTDRSAVTRRLARHVAETRFEDLNERAVHSFKRTLLDYLATALTGSQEPVSQQMLDYLASVDASRTAAVIGSSQRLSVLNAALLNGTSTHALDFDDGHTNASAHPAGPNFPAVLAVAEQKGLDAKRVILATVLGYDVMLRVSSATMKSRRCSRSDSRAVSPAAYSNFWVKERISNASTRVKRHAMACSAPSLVGGGSAGRCMCWKARTVFSKHSSTTR